MASFLACKGAVFSIDLDGESVADIPSGTIVEQLIGDLGFGEFSNMDITSDQELANQGVEAGDIDGVYLDRLQLDLVSPEGADFSFIDDIDFYVEGPDLPRMLVAESRPIEAGDRRVEFDIVSVDLTEYAISKSMTLSTEVSGRRPSSTTRVRASYVLDVGVTRQGCGKAVRGG